MSEDAPQVETIEIRPISRLLSKVLLSIMVLYVVAVAWKQVPNLRSLTEVIIGLMVIGILAIPLFMGASMLHGAARLDGEALTLYRLFRTPTTRHLGDLKKVSFQVGRSMNCSIYLRFSGRKKESFSDMQEGFWPLAKAIRAYSEAKGIPTRYGLLNLDQSFWHYEEKKSGFSSFFKHL